MSIPKSSTVIATLKDKKGRILMAADRRASWDFSMSMSMPRPKISYRNGILTGATGDGYLCHLLVDILRVENPKIDNIDPDIFMHYHYSKEVRKLLISQGFVDEHKLFRLPGDMYVEALIGFDGKVYSVTLENSNPTNEHVPGIIAIDEMPSLHATGCGALVAIGALKESEDLFMHDEKKDRYRFLTYKERLIRAVEKACDVSPGCGKPVDILVEDL